jgi:hypothetical protein
MIRVLTPVLFRMIRQSGLTIIPFDSLDDAAERAVQLTSA